MPGKHFFGCDKPLQSRLTCNYYLWVLCLVHLCPYLSLGATYDGAAPDGMTREGHEERIIGGTVPPEGKYPSLASGPITQPYLTSIVNETEPYEQTLRIERFIIHEKVMAQNFVKHTQFLYDIAVAKVVPSIRFSNRVSAVNLPTTCGEYELDVWMAGWGRGNNITRLTEVTDPIAPNDECDKWLKTLRPHYEITKLITCTRYEHSRQGWCWGDYGGPVFLIKNESHMVQVGIISVRPKYDNYCAHKGDYTLHTRVSGYLGWIHRRISGCGNHPFHPITEVDEEI